MFSFGIEHEVAFINSQDQFADFSCTQFAEFSQIIDQLPVYPDDYSQLRIGDAGIKEKRWYIEGFERFSLEGKVIDCIPKGVEIRTTIQPSIQAVIAELTDSFMLLTKTAARYGFRPTLVSFNPYHSAYVPQPLLNSYEHQRRQESPEKQTAYIPMLTYGPDLNISVAGLTPEQVIDIGKKLTFYSPYIVPFSFSSPFFQGKLWPGLSIRTYIRTGARPAVMVFMEHPEDLIKSIPSLTKIARIPSEVGRIEFKAFDSCSDFCLYAALLALLKGIILDQSLSGRAMIPDAEMHQISAHKGFRDDAIFIKANHILEAAKVALKDDPDIHLLQPLQTFIERRETPADHLKRLFNQLGSVDKVLQKGYA